MLVLIPLCYCIFPSNSVWLFFVAEENGDAELQANCSTPQKPRRRRGSSQTWLSSGQPGLWLCLLWVWTGQKRVKPYSAGEEESPGGVWVNKADIYHHTSEVCLETCYSLFMSKAWGVDGYATARCSVNSERPHRLLYGTPQLDAFKTRG